MCIKCSLILGKAAVPLRPGDNSGNWDGAKQVLLGWPKVCSEFSIRSYGCLEFKEKLTLVCVAE